MAEPGYALGPADPWAVVTTPGQAGAGRWVILQGLVNWLGSGVVQAQVRPEEASGAHGIDLAPRREGLLRQHESPPV